MYHIRILDTATRELARLDKPTGRRIVERINWLTANLDKIRWPADLTGFPKPVRFAFPGAADFFLIYASTHRA